MALKGPTADMPKGFIVGNERRIIMLDGIGKLAVPLSMAAALSMAAVPASAASAAAEKAPAQAAYVQYRDRDKALRSAMDAVNGSMQQKAQADQEAQAQAQAQAQTQARGSSQRSGSGGAYSGTGRAGRSGGGYQGGSGGHRSTAPRGGGGGYQPAQAPAPSSSHQGGSTDPRDYPNLWAQLQQGSDGPAIDSHGNCFANCSSLNW